MSKEVFVCSICGRKFKSKYSLAVHKGWHTNPVSRSGRKKLPRETRLCACGCGETFEVSITDIKRWVQGHGSRRNRIPRETRTCVCGCGETFECKVNNNKRYIVDHPHSEPRKPREIRTCACGCGETFEVTIKDKRSCIKYHSIVLSPNKPETVVLNVLNDLFPNDWKFVGDKKIWINGKNPDFINKDETKLIELFGDYWHSEEKTGMSNEQHVNERKEIFEKYGYKTLIIWENELSDLDSVTKRLIEFNGEK